MRPRFVDRLGAADAVTAANAALGFCAVAAVTATGEVALGARLVLLAAIADGLDGLVARRRGSSPVGHHLDALADVASFGVAPATLVFAAWYAPSLSTAATVLAVGVPALFVAVAVVRLALYTELDGDCSRTQGVPTTLAGTILAAGVLSGVPPRALVAGAAAACYLMVVPVTYPDLLDRDALGMGTIQAGAVLVPTAARAAFPRALLLASVAYLCLAPRFYWRE